MDLMKVLDQTVREIKREVNLKVLKVPEIEQKVLDATDNEPWGPHGSALAEIAQATKKFTECQMVMNVLWTRLRETGKDWRYVYKALAVIEYLIANGSDRAVDDIVEHTFQISSLSSFEYVEPNGKDMGINVRKKVETIVTLLNNKDKIQEVRNKAAANRDKYFGLSSSGISYKSSASAFGSSSFESSGHYGGMSSTRESDRFGSSSKDEDDYFEFRKQNQGSKNDNQEYSSRKVSTNIGSKHQDKNSSGASKPSTSSNPSNYNNVPSHVGSNDYDDDFDDFDPRGTSETKAVAASSNQVDLLGESLTGDLLDAPTSSTPLDSSTVNNSSEVDLFADASFVSAAPSMESVPSSQKQTEVDLFASQPASSPAASATVDLFATPDPVTIPQDKPVNPVPTNTNAVDPFDCVPLNSFDSSDPFGAFSLSSNSVTAGPSQSAVADSSPSESGKSPAGSGPLPKKDSFQVKSGIWADSLSRGIIDLNISAPKKVSLADVGVVGGLSDGSDEREKGPPTSFYMGRAMGMGSGLGKSSFTSSQSADIGDFFSNFSNQQYQYGSFKK